MSERLSNNSGNDNSDWYAPGLRVPPSEWVYNNTYVPPQPANPFGPSAPGKIIDSEEALSYHTPAGQTFREVPIDIDDSENKLNEHTPAGPRYENVMPDSEGMWDYISEEEQQENLRKHAEERQTARDTVESILNNDAQMLENVQKIAFNDNIRSEFLRDYKGEISKLISETNGDYSDAASQKVNKFAEDYIKTIFTMDNLQRESGDRLVNVASNKGDITGEDGGLRQISELLQKRRKNGCNVEIAVPINYSEDNPHPKMDGVLVANWLDQRINQPGTNLSDSTNVLKAQIRRNLQQ